MERAPQSHSVTMTALASAWVFVSLAGVVCGITLLFLSMRSVMEIGGACADGGPYQPVRPCPDGIPLTTIGGIWGGIVALGIYIWALTRFNLPGFLALAWPALFLSLGWNFFEFGFDPPGDGGLAWGWLFCGVVFAIMGGLPLIALLPSMVRSFVPSHPQGPVGLRDSFRPLKVTIEKAAPRQTHASPTPGDREPSTGLVAELERLTALRDSGSLSEHEFRLAKQRLLGDEP